MIPKKAPLKKRSRAKPLLVGTIRPTKYPSSYRYRVLKYVPASKKDAAKVLRCKYGPGTARFLIRKTLCSKKFQDTTVGVVRKHMRWMVKEDKIGYYNYNRELDFLIDNGWITIGE